MKVGDPVRDLSHLSPALRRRVEKRPFGAQICRPKTNLPRIADGNDLASSGS